MALTLILLEKDCLENGYIRWRKIYNESGELGLTIDSRGKTRTVSDPPQRNYQWKKSLKKLRQELNI